ncbi:hypothetical protein Tsubulata_015669, partial [Turnera subulata]
GTEAVEGIVLELPRPDEALLNAKTLSKMRNLRLLIFHNLHFAPGLGKLSDELRVLKWHEYPFKSLPSSFNAGELVELEMCYSQVEQLWKGLQLEQHQSWISPSFFGLYSLKGLDLSNCDLLEDSVLCDLSSLSTLLALNLSGNNFTTLPSSVSRLPKLEDLYVDDCKRLQSLQELTFNVNNVTARGCSSLDVAPVMVLSGNSKYPQSESTSCCDLMEYEDHSRIQFRMTRQNLLCFEVYHYSPLFPKYLSAEDMLTIQGLYNKGPPADFIQLGSEIPKWFNCRGLGNRITVKMPPLWKNGKWLGFAVAAVFVMRDGFSNICNSRLRCNMVIRSHASNQTEGLVSHTCLYENSNMLVKLDHFWLCYLPRQGFLNADWPDIGDTACVIEFNIIDLDDYFDVKECGVHLVFEGDGAEFDHGVRQFCRSNIEELKLVLYANFFSYVPHGTVLKQSCDDWCISEEGESCGNGNFQEELGTEAVEGIVLELPRPDEALLNAKTLSKMSNLRLLIFHNLNFAPGPGKLSDELRVLKWHEYPFKSLPSSFHAEELTELEMCYSQIEQLWKGMQNLRLLSLRGHKLEQHQSWISHPFFGLYSLKGLDLSNCDLLEDSVFSDLSSLSKLLSLNLSGNNFTTLPASVSRLPALEFLYVDDCKRLQSLQELPSNVKIVTARGCSSLNVSSAMAQSGNLNNPESESTIFCDLMEYQDHSRMEFRMTRQYLLCFVVYLCDPLFPEYLSDEDMVTIQGLFNKGPPADIIHLGSEIPKWFNCRGLGNRIAIKVPPLWKNGKWLGFAVAAVFVMRDGFSNICNSHLQCNMVIRSHTLNQIEGLVSHTYLYENSSLLVKLDHFWLCYLPRQGFLNADWPDIGDTACIIEFNIIDLDDYFDVKECGVHLVFEGDGVESDHGVRQFCRSNIEELKLVLYSNFFPYVPHGTVLKQSCDDWCISEEGESSGNGNFQEESRRTHWQDLHRPFVHRYA